MAHVVEVPDIPDGDVYVLGAGLSKAVYGRMPLTDELGRLVLAKLSDEDLVLGRPTFRPGGLTFESWLSWLGESQPFDEPEATHLRRALFVRLQRLIAETLDEESSKAMEEPAAGWLYALIQLFQLARATVITFNYDRVVEANLPLRLTDTGGEFIRPNDIVVPLFTETGVMFGGSGPFPRNVDAFDYLKLHGSVDWWVYPDDTSGSSLQQGGPTAELGRAERGIRGNRRQFIVPPTAQKSGYYSSELTKLLWRRAASALRTANRVALLGYSLPLTDNATASMLAGAVPASEATIDVVNPEAHAVQGRLESLGCDPTHIRTWGGWDSIERSVDARCDELAVAFARRFAALFAATNCLAFAWNAEQRAQVESVRLGNEGRDLVLSTEHIGGEGLIRPDAQLAEGQETSRALLMSDLPPGYERVQRIMLECGDDRWLAVGTVQRAIVDGPDDAHWTTLYPIGAPPR